MEVGEEEEETVWSWGAGTDGQLGNGNAHDQHLPQQLPLFPSSASRAVSRIACGGAHAIALLTGGRVLTWGRGNCGQLGHGDLLNILKPKLVEFFKDVVICHASAGWNHSGFVSDTGCLFTCGDGSFGQLGHGDYESHSSPVEVPFFLSKHVIQITCGMRHSLTLSKGLSVFNQLVCLELSGYLIKFEGNPSNSAKLGRIRKLHETRTSLGMMLEVDGTLGDSIHGFGSGRRGQLGISVDRLSWSYALPQPTNGLKDVEIATVSANGDHSAALSANGHLYIWGRGLGGASDAYHPQLLQSRLKFSQVALGWNHALLLTVDGEVLMLGGSHHGILSNHPQTSHKRQLPFHCTPCGSSCEIPDAPLIPMRVPRLDGKKTVEVAAGAEHSALVTDDGTIMTWGWGEHGQLGLGNTCDQTTPQIVRLVERKPMANYGLFRVYCGSLLLLLAQSGHSLRDDPYY